MENKETSTHANDYLDPMHSLGSEEYTPYMLGKVITSGAKDLAETFECFWFIDVICSHQLNQNVRSEEFQVWKLIKNKTGSGCKVVCEDGNDNKVIEQRIPYTDFKMETATLWLVDDVIMLPTEY